MTFQCFCCGKSTGDMTEAIGTVFYAHGNYGSTVFDPMNGAYSLGIRVCDECLRERAARVVSCRSEKADPVRFYARGIHQAEDAGWTRWPRKSESDR